MEYQKDYSLLRPFDLESAKIGDRLCLTCEAKHEHGERKYIAGPDSSGKICVQYKNGLFDVGRQDNYSMLPLAWVEGKPVYKGDVLYRPVSQFGIPLTVIGTFDLLGDSYLEFDGGNGTEFLDNRRSFLTWQKPKTKREGWVNIYPNKSKYVRRYDTKQEAEQHADVDLITTVHVDWEE